MKGISKVLSLGKTKKTRFLLVFCSLIRTFERCFEGTFVRKNKKNKISFGFLLTYSYLCTLKANISKIINK